MLRGEREVVPGRHCELGRGLRPPQQARRLLTCHQAERLDQEGDGDLRTPAVEERRWEGGAEGSDGGGTSECGRSLCSGLCSACSAGGRRRRADPDTHQNAWKLFVWSSALLCPSSPSRSHTFRPHPPFNTVDDLGLIPPNDIPDDFIC